MTMFQLRYANRFEHDVYAVQLMDVIAVRDVYFWVFTLRTGRWQGNVVWDVTENEEETARWMSAFAGRPVTTPIAKLFPQLIGRVAWAEMVTEVRSWDSPLDDAPYVMPKVRQMYPLDWAFSPERSLGDPFEHTSAD
jgi:hypothetical protein